MNDDVWYFAYGSNLWKHQKELRSESAIRSGDDRPRVVRLADFRLAFNKRSKNWRFAANIMLRPGEEVLGVIYRCGPATMNKMDRSEPGYERKCVPVTLDDGRTVEAITYVATPGNITADGRPSSEYVSKIVRGAREHGIPEEYVEKIKRLASASED